MKFFLHHIHKKDIRHASFLKETLTLFLLIFYLKHNDSITKHCLRHSELEDIKKMTRYKTNGGNETIYIITIHNDKEIIEETLKEEKS